MQYLITQAYRIALFVFPTTMVTQRNVCDILSPLNVSKLVLRMSEIALPSNSWI